MYYIMMANIKIYLLWLMVCMYHLTVIITHPIEDQQANRNTIKSPTSNQTTIQHNYNDKNYKDDAKTSNKTMAISTTASASNLTKFQLPFNVKPRGFQLPKNNTQDISMAASAYNTQQYLPVIMKPRGFHLPKNRPAQRRQDDLPQPAAQNYYSSFFPNIPPLGHSRPYYPLTEDPLITKFLSHQNKPFQPRHQSLAAYDASLLGSGDFGILKGGTFYSDEETSYINEEGSDFYYSESSNAHSSSTEGFIQKYTYPEEQFAQFRDFADLSTPADSAYSQYVVVYAAKNSTGVRDYKKPKNIFEQLQEIDKEKALEEKRHKKNQTNSSITKLKLVRTKLTEKKWIQRQPIKVIDDDPLIALS